MIFADLARGMHSWCTVLWPKAPRYEQSRRQLAFSKQTMNLNPSRFGQLQGKTRVITLLSNADLTSGASGAPSVLQGEALDFVCQASQITAFVYGHYVSDATNTELIVTGQWTLDGVNWTDFATSVFDGTGTSGLAGGHIGSVFNATANFGPTVRFNVTLKDSRFPGSGNAVVSGRISVSIVVFIP